MLISTESTGIGGEGSLVCCQMSTEFTEEICTRTLSSISEYLYYPQKSSSLLGRFLDCVDWYHPVEFPGMFEP